MTSRSRGLSRSAQFVPQLFLSLAWCSTWSSSAAGANFAGLLNAPAADVRDLIAEPSAISRHNYCLTAQYADGLNSSNRVACQESFYLLLAVSEVSGSVQGAPSIL